MKPIKVLIVDDHPIMIRGLRDSLNVEGIEVVGTAKNGQEAIEQAKDLQPDVVIIDWEMPGIDGLEATRIIKHDNPTIKLLLFSSFYSGALVNGALQNGASGYLAKIDIEPEHLQDAIRVVATGGYYITSEHAQKAKLSPAPLEDRLRTIATQHHLTIREVEVLRYISQGLSNPEIQTRMGIAESGLRTHVTNLFGKLGYNQGREARKLVIDMVNNPVPKPEDPVV